MAKEGGMGFGEIILLAVGGYLAYIYFFSSPAAATTTTTSSTGSTPPATTTGSTPPATTSTGSTPPAAKAPGAPPPQAPPGTPPPATTSIVGAVTTNVNNSLSANVNVNGTVTNVTIIYPAMSAWNTSGVNVTAQLTALGVNVPALAQAMLTAYNTANPGNSFVSGLSGFLPFIWGRGMGQMMRRPMPAVTRAAAGRNYVRQGSPMRRIG
jgi:hypothetical protein